MFSQSQNTQHNSKIITHIADTINNTNAIVLLICVWIYMLPTLLLPQTEQHRSPCTLISWGTSWTSVQSSWGTASARRCSPRSLSRTGQCSRSPTRSCQGATMRSSPSRWRRPCSELHCESDAVTVIQHAHLQLWWFIPTLWHFAGQEGGCGKTLSWCRPSELPRVRGSCCWLRRRLKVSDNRFSDAFFRF